MSIAQEEGRWQELKRQATTAQLYDVNVQILNKDEIKDKVPLIKNPVHHYSTLDYSGGKIVSGSINFRNNDGTTIDLAKSNQDFSAF